MPEEIGPLTPPQPINSVEASICHEAILTANELTSRRARSEQPSKQVVEQLTAEAATLDMQQKMTRAEFFTGVAQNLVGQAQAREHLSLAIKIMPTISDITERTRIQAALAALMTTLSADDPYCQQWEGLRDKIIQAVSTEDTSYSDSPLAAFSTQDFQNIAFSGMLLGLEQEFDKWKVVVFEATQEPLELTTTERKLFQQHQDNVSQEQKDRIV